MPVNRLDKTIAYKAIGLLSGLSGTDKRVATATLDHFNLKTGQCDPSLSRLARLLNLSTRTVIRSLNRSIQAGLFRKARHGGHSGRNSYEPAWSRFRQIDAEWSGRFRAKTKRTCSQDLSPGQCQGGHLDSDGGVNQSLSSNKFKEAARCSDVPRAKTTPSRGYVVDSGLARKEPGNTSAANRGGIFPRPVTPQSRDAARSAAERRLSTDLHIAYSLRPDAYGKILDRIDPEMWNAAVDAELERQGAGLAYIVEQLRMRGLR